MIGKESIVGKVIYGGGFVFDFARWLVILAVVLTLLHFFVITIYIVDGASMDPTLKTGEIAVLNKIVYDFGDPARGDIVVVKYPGDPENKRYVKRVIGLPNEKVEVRAGGVYINNKRLIENYLPNDVTTDKDGSWQLGEGEYFLLGDNRPNSNDSRYFGPAEKRFIIGRTDWTLLPLKSFVTPTYIL